MICVSLLAACHEPELSKLDQIKREVCACKDSACGDAAMKKLPTADGKPRVASRKDQLTARALVGCLARLYEADRAPADDETEEETDEP